MNFCSVHREYETKFEVVFAFSNTPVGGIGNVHKKLSLSSIGRSKNDKIRFFDEKCVSFGSAEVAMKDLVEILVSFSF